MWGDMAEDLFGGDQELEFYVRANYYGAWPPSPEIVERYRDELSERDPTYDPSEYQQEEPRQIKEPADLLRPFLRQRDQYGNPTESVKAYGRRIRLNLEAINRIIDQVDASDDVSYLKSDGRKGGRARAAKQARSASGVTGQLRDDIEEISSGKVGDLRLVEEHVGIVGQEEIPGYGEKQRKKQSWLRRLFFGEEDTTEQLIEQGERDEEVARNLRDWLLNEQGVDESVGDLIAKREAGAFLTTDEERRWEEYNLDGFYERHPGIRRALDEEFWPDQQIRGVESGREGRRQGPEEPPEQQGRGRRGRDTPPPSEPSGGRRGKRPEKGGGGGGVSMLDGEHGMWKPDEESRATFHKFAGLMEPFDKTPLPEGHGLTGAKKAGAPGLRPGKSR
jgi:hypothetical protein